MNILEKIKTSITYFDGGMGTMLQDRGLAPGELPELWNISHRDVIIDIHRQYYASGCNILKANTFGANRLKFDNLEEIITAAIDNANGVNFHIQAIFRQLRPSWLAVRESILLPRILRFV